MTDYAIPLSEHGLGDLRFPMDVRIPSDVRYIEPIVGVVVLRCAEEALPALACRLNVPVALTEALSNAILRGNGEDYWKAVRFRATIDDRALVFEVEDEGAGFDLEACLVVPCEGDTVYREDGRGLFLMRSLMDRVERVSTGANVVRLTLHRT
ncbi:MAG TPA: ATP-binding protein [Gemmatimonadaceae bacterium]|jgi:serine/threonine-protein kinase RsbW